MPKFNAAQMRDFQKSKSLNNRLNQLKDFKLDQKNVAQLLNDSEKVNKQQLSLTAKSVLLKGKLGNPEEALELVKWGAKAKINSRKTIVETFVKNKQSTLFIDGVAALKRTDARNLMKDYFSKGGDLKDVAEWLSEAGKILKAHEAQSDTDGLLGTIGSAIGSAASTVVDTVKKAINTVADAVSTAGKNLAKAVSSVASWTQSKVSDFVEAIINAGEKVGEILSEASKKGLSALRKFIKAVIDAGKKGIEILNWAVQQSTLRLRQALQRLEQVLGSFTSLIGELVKLAYSRLKTVVEALFALGKKVSDFLRRITRVAYHEGKLIVKAIKQIGKSVNEIVQALARFTRAVAKITLDALMEIGSSIFQILNAIIGTWAATRIANLLGALKDLGRSLSEVLSAVARVSRSFIIKAMQAVRRIWRKLDDLLENIARKSAHVIKTLLTAVIGTGIHLIYVIKSIANNIRDAFKESLIKGLLEIGKSALELVKEAVKIGASAAAVLFSIILSVLGSYRKLNSVEKQEAVKVFGSSVDLDMVRVTDANLASDLIMYLNGNRPFTTMYILNYKSGADKNVNFAVKNNAWYNWMSTLIHELAHVWQAENSGGVYMLEALHSQFFGKGYNITDQDVRNAKGDLLNLEREQQAVLVEEYWKNKFHGISIPLSLSLIEPLAKQVFELDSRRIRIPRFEPIQIDPSILRRIRFAGL